MGNEVKNLHFVYIFIKGIFGNNFIFGYKNQSLFNNLCRLAASGTCKSIC